MTFRWVLNASPIICLAKAGLERLLIDIPSEVAVPKAVAVEITSSVEDDPAKKVLMSGQLPIIDLHILPEIQSWDLGAGETAVLSYALSNSGWEAIIDDQAARKCARTYAISHRGTLAVIIIAKKQGIISSATEAIRSLRAAGIWLDDATIREAIKYSIDEVL
jgi:predicted nucleic acid-binding protein